MIKNDNIHFNTLKVIVEQTSISHNSYDYLIGDPSHCHEKEIEDFGSFSSHKAFCFRFTKSNISYV